MPHPPPLPGSTSSEEQALIVKNVSTKIREESFFISWGGYKLLSAIWTSWGSMVHATGGFAIRTSSGFTVWATGWFSMWTRWRSARRASGRTRCSAFDINLIAFRVYIVSATARPGINCCTSARRAPIRFSCAYPVAVPRWRSRTRVGKSVQCITAFINLTAQPSTSEEFGFMRNVICPIRMRFVVDFRFVWSPFSAFCKNSYSVLGRGFFNRIHYKPLFTI